MVKNNGVTVFYVELKGHTYPARQVPYKHGTANISVERLNDIMNDGDYPDDDAKKLDEEILGYVPDKNLFEDSDEELLKLLGVADLV